jgi:hypothetical protein
VVVSVRDDARRSVGKATAVLALGAQGNLALKLRARKDLAHFAWWDDTGVVRVKLRDTRTH